MGGLKITPDVLVKNATEKDFSREVFDHVLHHVMEFNSTTLGRIAAYGLGRDETSGEDPEPLRITTLEDVMPQVTFGSGGFYLEVLAASTIVAAAFDLLVGDLEEHCQAMVSEDDLIWEALSSSQTPSDNAPPLT